MIERTRKFKATTDSDHTFNIAPNLLDRDFVAHEPNQKWVGDFSYIWIRDWWLYLAGCNPGPEFEAGDRLGRRQPDEARSVGR